MDVRCEKCGTEYELDEARLKPGGVTVKCTSCGHMFKIRKRAGVTGPGLGAVGPRAASASGVPRPVSQTDGSGPSDRNWIIRLANGEQRTCRELATLQQWIIVGDVTRDAMISRSGKTWKQLGDIPELAQFFDVAEEARDRSRRESGRVTAPQQPQRPRPGTPKPDKATLLGVPSGVAPLPRRPATQPPPPPKPTLRPLGGQPVNDGAAATLPSMPRAKLSTPASAPAAPIPSAASAPTLLSSGPMAAPPSTSEPAAGSWATVGVQAREPDAGASFGGKIALPDGRADTGGFGGAIKPVPTHDVAFASSLGRGASLPPPTSDTVDRFVFDEETGPVMPRRAGGGAGKWIAIVSLVLIAGAAAAFYVVVLRPGGGRTAEVPAPGAAIDAGAPLVSSLVDAGAATSDPAVSILAATLEILFGDGQAELEAAAADLADRPDQDGVVLALRARIGTALAQQLDDRATLEPDSKAAAALRKDAKKRIADALALGQKAVKNAGDEPLAHVAMADVLRLQNKPAKDVQRHLDRALELAPADREALLVKAMLAARDGKSADARQILDELDQGHGALERTGDVRPRFRSAMLAFKAGNRAEAQQLAEQVVAAAADHVAAQRLLARLADAVDTSDPMPPEDRGTVAGTGKGTGAGTGTATSGGGGATVDKPDKPDPPDGNYDSLLARADKLAEGGNCSGAEAFYEKALQTKPNGVGALTGRGYCYLDGKHFKSAHSSFRAALAVSPRYEPALWGIAETYAQQGNKEAAIEAYMRYLEVYPGKQKAIKQIERLGGSTSKPDSGGGDSGGGDSGGGGSSGSEPEPSGSE
jgi:predicted Zn finger-like uncharacterized protein